jgi:hypothetical protein
LATLSLIAAKFEASVKQIWSMHLCSLQNPTTISSGSGSEIQSNEAEYGMSRVCRNVSTASAQIHLSLVDSPAGIWLAFHRSECLQRALSSPSLDGGFLANPPGTLGTPDS